MRSNNKYEMQQAMTWNMRCLRSGFGKQVYSTKPTEPGIGIGSSNRDAFLQQYLSAEHAKATGGNNSQGAVYRVQGSIGPQPDSQRPNSACAGIGTEPRLTKLPTSWVPGPGTYKTDQSLGPQRDSRRANSAKATFGGETRDGRNKQFMDEELEKTFYGRGSPGPMMYQANSSLGKQALSTKETGHQAKFGTGGRFKDAFLEEARHMPGAGHYNSATAALGKQIRSRNQTLPSYGFGSSTRDGMKHVFISLDHEKASHGVGTPGPTTSNRVSAFRSQTMSGKASAPSWGFGTGPRLSKYNTEGVPGPGAYCA